MFQRFKQNEQVWNNSYMCMHCIPVLCNVVNYLPNFWLVKIGIAVTLWLTLRAVLNWVVTIMASNWWWRNTLANRTLQTVWSLFQQLHLNKFILQSWTKNVENIYIPTLHRKWLNYIINDCYDHRLPWNIIWHVSNLWCKRTLIVIDIYLWVVSEARPQLKSPELGICLEVS